MAYLTLGNLIDDDGELNCAVYRAMIRRRALNEHGALSPSALRAAIQYYSPIIPVLIRAQRDALQGESGQ